MIFHDVPINVGSIVQLLHSYTYMQKSFYELHICIYLSTENFMTIMKEYGCTSPEKFRLQGAEVCCSAYQKNNEVRIFSE